MMPAPARNQVSPVAFVDRPQGQRGIQPAVGRKHHHRAGIQLSRASSRRRMASTPAALGMPDAVTAGNSVSNTSIRSLRSVQPGGDRRTEVLHAAALPHRHEIDDRGGAGFGDLGDLLKRAAHRHGVLDDFLECRIPARRGPGGRARAAAQRPGAGQRFGDHHAVAVVRPPPVRGCSPAPEIHRAATGTNAQGCCVAGPADRWTESPARTALHTTGQNHFVVGAGGDLAIGRADPGAVVRWCRR